MKAPALTKSIDIGAIVLKGGKAIVARKMWTSVIASLALTTGIVTMNCSPICFLANVSPVMKDILAKTTLTSACRTLAKTAALAATLQ